MLANMQAQASAMGMTIVPAVLQTPEGLDAAFSTVIAAGPEALHLLADSGNQGLTDRIADFALQQRLPSFSTLTRFAEFGGLIAYGASLSKLLVRAGYFTKRILDGTKPADLPVEQPTRVELWINLKTAKSLKLAVPATLLAVADEVIE